MEKLCKRCLFRTPHTRAICQVCGHDKFVPIEGASRNPGVNVEPKQPPATTPVDSIGELGNAQSSDNSMVAFAKSYCAEAVYEFKQLCAKVGQSTESLRHLCASLTMRSSLEPSDVAKTLVTGRNNLNLPVSQPAINAESKHSTPSNMAGSTPALGKADMSRVPVGSSQVTSRSTISAASAPAENFAPPVLDQFIQPLVLGDAAAQQSNLNALLDWFRNYGRDGLIVARKQEAVDAEIVGEVKNAA